MEALRLNIIKIVMLSCAAVLITTLSVVLSKDDPRRIYLTGRIFRARQIARELSGG
jgi:hypothetical protein